MKPLSPAELAALAAVPGELELCSPLFDCPYLLVNLGGEAATTADGAAIAEAMAKVPAPVIGLLAGDTPAPPLARAMDVLAASEKDLAILDRNIRAHPLAAATLVQLLRHNEHATVRDGLLAESLAFAALQASADFRAYLATQPAPAACEDGEPIHLDRDGDELRITFNHGHRRNAYSRALRDAFYEALLLVAADTTIRRAIVTGDGDCFCTGGDLTEFGLAQDAAQAHLVRASRPVPRLLAELAPRLEFRVHRACIGSGLELPAFAGRLLASGDTIFQLPEITLGLIPGAGGTVSIPRRIGRQRTAWLALSARRIRADQALAWGLIDGISDV